jgi:hypothetical protein
MQVEELVRLCSSPGITGDQMETSSKGTDQAKAPL